MIQCHRNNNHTLSGRNILSSHKTHMSELHENATLALRSQKATARTPDGKTPGESKSSPREIQNYLGRIPNRSRISHLEFHSLCIILGIIQIQHQTRIRCRLFQKRAGCLLQKIF